jgi:hypothetical protein
MYVFLDKELCCLQSQVQISEPTFQLQHCFWSYFLFCLILFLCLLMYCSLGPTALDIVYLLFVFSDFSLIQGYLSKWSSSFFFYFLIQTKIFLGLAWVLGRHCYYSTQASPCCRVLFLLMRDSYSPEWKCHFFYNLLFSLPSQASCWNSYNIFFKSSTPHSMSFNHG